MRTVAFCEIDPACQNHLHKNWPGVPVFHDVKQITRRLICDHHHIQVDVICGGFPCQDISQAGLGAGIDGERSGLWREFARIIGEIRPKYAIVENVAALTFRGLLRVLGDIAALGLHAEWHCIQAADVGAKHIRDRVWIVILADPSRLGLVQRGWQQFKADGDSKRKIRERFDQPEPIRVANGIPGRMDKIRALGNAVVPQIPEIIGRAIMQAEGLAA